MCTVTYFPSKTGFFLTSTRDEVVHRETESPAFHSFFRKNILFPKDVKSGGTWIATDGENRTVCLLNGAWSNHQKAPSYRKSRGQLPIEIFRFEDIDSFWKEFDFEGVEPFTLLVLEIFPDRRLVEIRWDGQKIFNQEKNPNKAFLWSSYTLYPPHIQNKRNLIFERWLRENEDWSSDKIKNFHLLPEFQNMGGLSSNPARSVSLTQIKRNFNFMDFNYINLITKVESHLSFKTPLGV